MDNQKEIEPVVKKLKISEQKSDFEYWQSQSYQARLNALEQIREDYNQWKYHAQQGFQRVYQIVKR